MKKILLLCCLLASCEQRKPATVNMGESTSGDVEITRVGTFDDGLAYGERRGIYRIVDKRSGKEYLGISGIGIAEVGAHQQGKSRFTDER